MIKRVEVDDYSPEGQANKRKLVVSEFAGRLCLLINDGDNKCEVLFKDLCRAWEAVKAE